MNPYAIGFGVLFACTASLSAYLFQNNQKLTTTLEKKELRIASAHRQITELNKPNDADKELAELRQQLQSFEQQVAEFDSVKHDLEQRLEQAIGAGNANIDSGDDQVNITLLNSLLFTAADAHITTDGEEVLKSIGDTLKQAEGTRIRIVGHTDDLPISERLQYRYPSNWELGAMRAINVAKYLRQKLDIDPSKIEAVSAAQYQPMVENDSEENRAKNRRIEILLVKE